MARIEKDSRGTWTLLVTFMGHTLGWSFSTKAEAKAKLEEWNSHAVER